MPDPGPTHTQTPAEMATLGLSSSAAPARTQLLKIQALCSGEEAYSTLSVSGRCWLRLVYNLLLKAPNGLPIGTSLPTRCGS